MSEPKIIARVFGGLGNQLFIYATARALALRNSVPLILDAISGYMWDETYKRKFLLDKFRIQADILPPKKCMLSFSGRLRRRFYRSINRSLPFESIFYLTEKRINEFNPKLLSFRVRRPTWLEGYWHDERYFVNARSQLINELSLVYPLSPETKEVSLIINQSPLSVCLHLRSYKDIPGQEDGSGALPIPYYMKGIEKIFSIEKASHFFVFSDDPNWAYQKLKLKHPATFVTHNYARGDLGVVEDLWLMSQCKYFIIANSSLSWWGAWLSLHEDKLIFYPSENIHNLPLKTYPLGWNSIPIS